MLARYPRKSVHEIIWSLRCTAYPALKRLLDILVASAMLLAISPLLILVALAIRLEDGGPVLFVQERVGRGGRRFRFFKFRSMGTDAERRRTQLAGRSDDGDPIRFKMKRDPRITRVGRWLRRFSIDELPQLWHVVTGHMTLVGPRPPIPEETSRYEASDWRRLDVTPGLTCLWQVSGRATIPFPRQVALDLEYIHNRTLWLDLGVLARTVPAVLTGRGAF